MRRIEALDAERKPVDAGGAESGEFLRFCGAGVGFQGDFGIPRQRQAGTDGGEYGVDGVPGKEAGGAAAEEDADDLPSRNVRQGGIELGRQRCNVIRFRQRLALAVRVEVAVRAFAYAPGDVHIKGERRERLEGLVGLEGRKKWPQRRGERARHGTLRWRLGVRCRAVRRAHT